MRIKPRHKNYIHDEEWRRIHVHRLTMYDILEDMRFGQLEYMEPIWGKGIALQFWLGKDCGCILELTKGRDGVNIGYVPFYVSAIERNRESYRAEMEARASQRRGRATGLCAPAPLTISGARGGK